MSEQNPDKREKKSKHLVTIAVFVLGFAFAALLFRGASGGGSVLEAAKAEAAARAKRAGAITTEELEPFFQAVAKGDFSAMAKLGEKVFLSGRTVDAAEKTLAGYETNSFPPYTVYAFYVANTPDKTRRVLLTLDGDNRVESFLAEEMSVIK